GARAGARRRGAGGGFPVGGRFAVFELAFGHFTAVGVDGGVQRRQGFRDRRRGFGHDRRRRHIAELVSFTGFAGPPGSGHSHVDRARPLGWGDRRNRGRRVRRDAGGTRRAEPDRRGFVQVGSGDRHRGPTGFRALVGGHVADGRTARKC